MPNWVYIRAYLSGPADELDRFRQTCIRSHAELDEAEVGFDFEALAPTPPEIVATIEDKSAEAKRIALATHGAEGWHDWRLRHWGSKWNAFGFQENSSSAESLDFAFDTPWSFPRPIFAALARLFPKLTGQVFATEWGNDWGVVGYMAGGRFQQAEVEITRELQYLAEARTVAPGLMSAMAGALAEVFARAPATTTHPVLSGMTEEQAWAALEARSTSEEYQVLRSALLPYLRAEPDGVETWRRDLSIESIWDAVERELAAPDQRQLAFAFDVERYLDHNDEDSPWFCRQFDDDDELLPLEVIMHDGDTLRFLEADGRSYSKIDRDLLLALACHLRAAVGSTEGAGELEEAFRREAANLLVQRTEDELYEWAAHAVWRPGVKLDLSTLETLQHGFVEYASLLYRSALEFLGRPTVLEARAA